MSRSNETTRGSAVDSSSEDAFAAAFAGVGVDAAPVVQVQEDDVEDDVGEVTIIRNDPELELTLDNIRDHIVAQGTF